MSYLLELALQGLQSIGSSIALLFNLQISHDLCNTFDLTTGLQLGLDAGNVRMLIIRPIIYKKCLFCISLSLNKCIFTYQ